MPEINGQLHQDVADIHALLDAPMFDKRSSEDDLWKPEFIRLIGLVHSVLTLADQAGKRVNFIEGVGVNGKMQDIISLLSWLHTHLPKLTTDTSGQVATNRLNRDTDRGWGYFANDSFFTAEFNNDLAFFMDDQRVYVNRHIRRAVVEVEHSFSSQL